MDFTYREASLQCAIESGDLNRVIQLVESGINLNSVLHSVSRRESSTVLGMAAFEGQIEIMEYLLESGASTNIKDPYFGRNALHWACQGGCLAAVQLLLKQKVDLNCVDRDNVSPLVRASMTGNPDVVQLLIKHGAEISQQDRLRSSALHYSTFHGPSTMTDILIRAGCIHNNTTIFGQGTPLANLIYHADLTNCLLLIEAGYSLENESWLHNFNNVVESSTQADLSVCLREVLKVSRKVPPLIQVCRNVVRRVMTGANLESRLLQLPLPESLISYVCLL